MSTAKRKLAKNVINWDLSELGIHPSIIRRWYNNTIFVFLPIALTSRFASLKTIIESMFYHPPLQQGTQKSDIFHNQLI